MDEIQQIELFLTGLFLHSMISKRFPHSTQDKESLADDARELAKIVIEDSNLYETGKV